MKRGWVHMDPVDAATAQRQLSESMFRALALCVAVLLAGCGEGGGFSSICISPEFSAQHQEAIVEATEKWFYAIPEAKVPVAICDSGEDALRIVESRDPTCIGELSGRRVRDSRGTVIELCREMVPSTHRTALHELGHAFGAVGHLPPGNVMSEHIHGSKLTVHDVMFVRDALTSR